MSDRLFKIRFPGVTMRENLGGKRAIVLMSGRPQGSEMVLAMCVDIDGQVHVNVPFSLGAIKYAAEHSGVNLVEEKSGILAPSGGLVGADGRRLT